MMNSKKAKEAKALWKKEKAYLRFNIEATKEIYNNNALVMETESDEKYKEFCGLLAKQQKLEVCVMSYLYNEDYDNAVKYVNKHKEFAYQLIEKVEKMSQDNVCLSVTNSYCNLGVVEEHEPTDDEGTYIKLCKDTKETIEMFDKYLLILSVVICEVRDIRKADKRMRKRKKKKQGNV